MIANNILCYNFLNSSLYTIHMIKSLIPFCIFWTLVRKHCMKFICKLNCIFHNIFGITGMYTFSSNCQYCTCGMKTLITHIAKHSTIHCIGIICAKSFYIKKCNTVANFLVWSKSNTNFPMFYFWVCQQILCCCHNLSNSRLIITAKQSSSICHNQALALTIFQHRKFRHTCHNIFLLI